MELVPIDHYSDVLCIWAYCAQIRLDELRATFGDRVSLRYRFVPVFASTARKFGVGWADRGGFSGYARHVQEIAGRFPHIAVHADVWERVRPASSSSPHLFLKAVQLLEGPATTAAGSGLERAAWAIRTAIFRDARHNAHRSVQLEVAEELTLPRASIEAALDDGRAFAALFDDVEAQASQKIEGSPTLVFNEGRQKLYGNVGYRVIQASIEELLRSPDTHRASWC
jgi:predicted DsbA family dithiol-disulfide isomerase